MRNFLERMYGCGKGLIFRRFPFLTRRKQVGSKSSESEEEGLGLSLIKSVDQPQARESIAILADAGLDVIVDGGAFDGVPVIGAIISLYGTINSIRERIFLQKIAKFLQAAGEASSASKVKLLEETRKDKSEYKKLGEALILLLERHDHFDKSTILGHLFCKYIEGRIARKEFFRAAKAIDDLFVDDLLQLPSYVERLKAYDASAGKPFRESLSTEICENLFSAGLMVTDSYMETIYRPSSLCEQLAEVVFSSASKE